MADDTKDFVTRWVTGYGSVWRLSCQEASSCDAVCFAPAHAFEQYFTCSQSRAHFLRHAKGRPQVTHILDGKSRFFNIFDMMVICWGLLGQMRVMRVWRL